MQLSLHHARWSARSSVLGSAASMKRGRHFVSLAAVVLCLASLPAVSAWAQSAPGSQLMDGPGPLAVVGHHLWVTDDVNGELFEFSTVNGALIRATASSSCGSRGVREMAATAKSIWVADSPASRICVFNAANGELEAIDGATNFHLSKPGALTIDGNILWVVNSGDGSLSEISLINGALIRVVRGSKYRFALPDAVAVCGPYLWVANSASSSLTEIKASTTALVRIVSGAQYDFSIPKSLICHGSLLLVGNQSNNSITEVSSSNGIFAGSISISQRFPFGLVRAGSTVWVLSDPHSALLEICFTPKVTVLTFSGPKYHFGYSTGIASNGPDLWVSNGGSNSVTEISASNGDPVRVFR